MTINCNSIKDILNHQKSLLKLQTAKFLRKVNIKKQEAQAANGNKSLTDMEVIDSYGRAFVEMLQEENKYKKYSDYELMLRYNFDKTNKASDIGELAEELEERGYKPLKNGKYELESVPKLIKKWETGRMEIYESRKKKGVENRFTFDESNHIVMTDIDGITQMLEYDEKGNLVKRYCNHNENTFSPEDKINVTLEKGNLIVTKDGKPFSFE